MGVYEDRVFSAGWFWLACTRRPGRDVAGEGECYVALRSVRGSVLLVLLRHRGDGGCKLGFWGAGEGRANDGRRSTHLHGIRRSTRRLEIRFAPPPPSIPTSLPFMPNCTPACLAHPPESLHLDDNIFVDHCQCFATRDDRRTNRILKTMRKPSIPKDVWTPPPSLSLLPCLQRDYSHCTLSVHLPFNPSHILLPCSLSFATLAVVLVSVDNTFALFPICVCPCVRGYFSGAHMGDSNDAQVDAPMARRSSLLSN